MKRFYLFLLMLTTISSFLFARGTSLIPENLLPLQTESVEDPSNTEAVSNGNNEQAAVTVKTSDTTAETAVPTEAHDTDDTPVSAPKTTTEPNRQVPSTEATLENQEQSETEPKTATNSISPSQEVTAGTTTTEGATAPPLAEDVVAEKLENTGEKKSYKPKEHSIWDRYFEFGFSAGAGLGNNYLSIKDLFFNNGEVVLDFNQMAESKLLPGGFKTNTVADFSSFLNFNITDVHVGFATNFDAHMRFVLNKESLRAVANGNNLNTPQEVGAGFGVAIFLDKNVSTHFNIQKWQIGIETAYFLPIAYLPYTKATATFQSDSSGKMTSKISARALLYSPFSLEALIKGQFAPVMIQEAVKQGGFDISASLAYPVLEDLLVGGYIKSVPIVPARLTYAGEYSAKGSYMINPALPAFVDSSDYFNGNQPDFVTTNNDVNKKVFRPLRFAGFVGWKPFSSDDLVLSGTLEVRFLDAIANNKAGFSVGYIGDIRGTFGPFTPFFETKFMDEMFGQTLGFKLNLRAIELDFSLGSESTSFFKSFIGTGVKANVALILGF